MTAPFGFLPIKERNLREGGEGSWEPTQALGGLNKKMTSGTDSNNGLAPIDLKSWSDEEFAKFELCTYISSSVVHKIGRSCAKRMG